MINIYFAQIWSEFIDWKAGVDLDSPALPNCVEGLVSHSALAKYCLYYIIFFNKTINFHFLLYHTEFTHTEHNNDLLNNYHYLLLHSPFPRFVIKSQSCLKEKPLVMTLLSAPANNAYENSCASDNYNAIPSVMLNS